jgi:hypothetical protein
MYLSYFKQGHVGYFNFYPVIAQKKMKMINDDYETFWDLYMEAKEDDKSFIFEDDYLNTAVNHGFFGEDAFPEIVDNVQSVFKPLIDFTPEIF